jgi:hypothetical protein
VPFTTLADYENFTGQDVAPEDEARLSDTIDSSERLLARRCGRFYDEDDRTTDASKDWIEATCLITQSRWLIANDPEAQAALVGPYRSETLGDYRYEVKQGGGGAGDPLAIPRVDDILGYYCPVTLPAALTGMALAGPTRSAPPVYDPDVARGGDVSRGGRRP